MRYAYDLHIHSALSPCAENDMTPVTVVGQAVLNGLHFVAVSDHNAVGHAPVALRAGEEFGILAVPAVEVQTNEDIHLLCLFPDLGSLEAFFAEIPVSTRDNRPDLFGDQLLLDEDDNIVGTERRMLLDSAAASSDEVFDLAAKHGGAAVPAHIDRESNSMLRILGDIPDKFATVELSTRSTEEERAYWSARKLVIIDSDAHTLDAVSEGECAGEIELEEYSVAALVRRIAEGRKE